MLEAQNLTKHYNGACALDGLNLKVEPGEVFCLLGANGAGKTTTINLFLNFITPTAGLAKVDGVDVTLNPDAARSVLAYLPEQVMLYPTFTGVENLDYFSRLAGHRYRPEQLHEFLKQTGLPEKAHNLRINTYSKGMRQKVGLAIALAKQAKALLLDEPTSGLDPQASFEFSETVAQLAASGKAILMASHDLFRVKESGTRAGIMKQGHLMATVETNSLNASDLEQLYLHHMRHDPGQSVRA